MKKQTDVKQVVIRHLDKRFEIVYMDKPAVSIPEDEASWSAVSRALVALGYEVTEKRS